MRLAHRLCNRVDYSKQIDRPYADDLARVKAAREEAIHRAEEDPLNPRRPSLTNEGPWADEGEDGEDGARHIVPWSAVVEFTGPPTGPPMVVSPS